MAEAPGELTSAIITNWLQGSKVAFAYPQSRNVPHSVKRPLESRVWYRYPDQAANHHGMGSGTSPSLTGRVLEGGVSQVTAATYNAQGMVTAKTDAVGRQTTYTYATNGLDLLEVRQVRTGGGTDLLQSYANYTNHLPGTVTDGAGQTTTMTHNARGQVLSVTNAKSETTTTNAFRGTVPTAAGVNTFTVVARDSAGNQTSQAFEVSVTGQTRFFTYDANGHLRHRCDSDCGRQPLLQGRAVRTTGDLHRSSGSPP
jgi:YD repeat-containing protein